MKTHNRLIERIASFDNLLLAARKARKGKRSNAATLRFDFELEKNLLRLERLLAGGQWHPGFYRDFWVFDPKHRLISAAPYPDRVVHHAVCNVVEPLFERSFIHDSYACRRGKGTHAAVDRYTAFARKNRFVLKCDVAKYFPSIDHEILMEKMARRVRCRPTLDLIDRIVASRTDLGHAAYFAGDDLFTPYQRPKGIPIGNLTSQFLANVYLDGFDHHVKETLRCRHYIRYVDDWVVFGDSKAWLGEIKDRMEEYLAGLRLRLHPKKTRVYRVSEGVAFLGYRVFPDHRLLKQDNVLRMRRRLKRMRREYAREEISLENVRRSVHSWIGHARHADTYRLRERLLGEAAFQRGAAGTAARRLVEQRS